MPVDFQPEIEFEPEAGSLDPYYRSAEKGLRGAGGAVMGAVGKVSSAVDKYNPLGAPLRAGIGAAQEGKPVVQAYANQFLREPDAAPSGKQLMSRFGVSEEDFNTPLISNPFTGEHFKVSPAGIAGGAAEAVLDPTLFIPGGAASKGLKAGSELVEHVAPRVGKSIAEFAEERAVKAATGENRSAIKKLARVKGQSAGDVDKVMGRLRGVGRRLLEPDDAGAPAIGWLSNSEDIGREAAAKKRFYGQQIGNVGPVVDRLAPDAITPRDLALDVSQFQREIPNVGKGAPVRKRVGEEAGRLEQLGLAEDELGPPAPLNFAKAQELKAQYPYEPQSPDILISDKDATNRINRIISDKMDAAVGRAKAGTTTPEDLAILEKYGPSKQAYGDYKNVADAGTEQSMRTLGRRMVSPSSNFLGATAGGAVAKVKEDLAKGGLWGAAVGLVNQQLLERGSAFGAKGADFISKKILQAPGQYQKWLPTMQKAAKAGNAAVLATHHQLMQSDPDYRRLMFEGSEEP